MRLFGRGPGPGDVGWDLHSHLVPGVDDGVADAAEAVECARQLRELGYGGAVTTPHIRPGHFDNEETQLRAAFEDLRPEVERSVPGFSMALAAEYFFDGRLIERLEAAPDGLLTFGPRRSLLLVELPTETEPFGLDRMLAAAREAGLGVVLAHPERYRFLRDRAGAGRLAAWRREGLLVQVNVGAYGGMFGAAIAHAARRFHRAGLVDLVGTDLHRPEQMQGIRAGWRWLGRRGRGFDAATQFSITTAG